MNTEITLKNSQILAPDEFTNELISDIIRLTKEERKELLAWMKTMKGA